MKIKIRLCFVIAAAITLALVSGCATPRKTSSTRPLSKPEVVPPTEATTAPETRSVTELMRAANEAFRRANEAQEAGDQEAALRHYTQMLELLIKADLDPGVFYNLRGEFERILNNTNPQNKLFDKAYAKEFPTRDGNGKLVAGDLSIPGPLPERVIQQVEEIQSAYPRNFERGLNRSFKYLPYIREEFAKAGLPQDLVWLAQVESQFYTKAVSPAGAGGMWQFMRGTAKRYDIRMDSYVDERYNWKKATHAAIAYLSELYQEFDGNWPLAISAYNMGEGGVARAVAASGGERDLWKLIDDSPASSSIPNETKNFYAKLLATIIVARNPERYGLNVQPSDPDEVEPVQVSGSYRLAELEQTCSLPEGTLATLNPELVRGVTPPDGHTVAVPATAKEQFVLALNSATPLTGSRLVLAAREADEPSEKVEKKSSRSASSTPARAKTHLVRRGETLSSVAEHYKLSIEDVAKANRMRTSARLMSGQRLTIPAGVVPETETAESVKVARSDDTLTEEKASAEAANKSVKEEKEASKSAAPAAKESASSTYTVKSGDTVEKISIASGVPIKEIVDTNNLSKDHLIRVGQTLKLSSGASKETAKSAPAAPAARSEHIVRTGETLGEIAQKYGVSVSQLLEWNRLKQGTLIRVGQKLALRAPAKEEAPKGQPSAKASSSMTEEKVSASKTKAATSSKKTTAPSTAKATTAKADAGRKSTSTKTSKQ